MNGQGKETFHSSKKINFRHSMRKAPERGLASPLPHRHRPGQPNSGAAYKGHVSSRSPAAPPKQYVAKTSLRKALRACFLSPTHPFFH